MAERVKLTDTEIMALKFLMRGPDCIGVIDTEEKFAAAIVFANLHQQGLVLAEITPVGPEYRLTTSGRSALEQSDG